MNSDAGAHQRLRLIGVLKHIGQAAAGATVNICDDGYQASRGWLGRRARVDIMLPADPSGRPVWREVAVDFTSGEDALYPYYPFCAFVYTGNTLAAVVEFMRAEERRTAYLRLPSGSRTQLTVVSEVSGTVDGDDRLLAVLLGQVRVGRAVAAPRSAARHRPIEEDYSSQFLFPLDREIARPAFVIGAYRSGTSILTWALGQHPNILAVEETRWLHLLGEGARAGFFQATRAARNFFVIHDLSEREYMAHFGLAVDSLMRTLGLRLNHRTALARIVGKLEQRDGTFDKRFQIARSAFNPKRRWVDGSPENAAAIPVIRLLFPAARFLFAIRDPFDVIASMTRFDRAGGTRLSAEEAALMWLRLTNYGWLAYRAYGPEVVKIVPHADMVAKPAGCLREVFDFLGEPRFERASETFGARLNSSRIPEAERGRIVAEVRAELLGGPATEQIFKDVLRALGLPWVCDTEALAELNASSWDTVERMMDQLR